MFTKKYGKNPLPKSIMIFPGNTTELNASIQTQALQKLLQGNTTE
jgi:hypothetical protein